MKNSLIFLLCLLPISTLAQKVELSSYFGDNMILQCSIDTKITGKTTPETTVNIILKDSTKKIIASTKTTSDITGDFATKLNLKKYGTNYTLTIGENTYKNVAVGELWLISGQSNMAWTLAESNNANSIKPQENIRLLLYTPTFEVVRIGMSQSQLDDLNALKPYAKTNGWKIAQGNDARNFSAIGVFFATRLREMMPNVPIGLIQTAMGGAPIESFLPRNIIEKDVDLKRILENNWIDNEEANEWCRNMAKANLKGIEDISQQRHYFAPSYLYDARIAPLKGTTIKGVLWYQGESNADNIKFHNRAFYWLVQSWRELFDNLQLPFYFVQLSSHNRASWPAFRDSQRKLAQKINFCEMVVSHDYGDSTNVHPRDKQPIAIRLANIALYRDYKFSNIKPYSPLPKKFDNKNNLILYNGDRLTTSDGNTARGFEISDDGKNYTPASVMLMNNAIHFSSPNRPKFIRYAWKPSTDANVVNRQGLPLSTFILQIPYLSNYDSSKGTNFGIK